MQELNLDTRDPAAQGAPPEVNVRAELQRILLSPHLQASERRRAFLRYIVEETLSGRAGRLKGYTIATTVFGRDETFDSQADPVVRLEARRLRRDLDSYYVDAGSRDPVRISIPKGSYVPHFEWHGEGQPLANSCPEQPATLPPESNKSGAARIGRPRRLLVAALLVMLVAIAAAAWYPMAGENTSGSGAYAHEPAVIILPFKALSLTEHSRTLADGISQELVADLMRFPGFRLYTLPLDFEKDLSPEPVKLGQKFSVAYVVDGSVRVDPKEIRVATKMFDATTGHVLWTGTYDRPLTPEALIRVQRDLAGEIATVLGQPYGVVRKDLDLRANTPEVSSMQSYVCVLRAYGYRRTFSREAFGPILECLEESVRRDPGYSDAWAMLGWLHLDSGRYEYGALEEEYAKAMQAASQAVALEPDNTLALKALAAINHYIGRYEDSERLARQAVDLNPHDPDTLAQLGWRLAVRGNFSEGIPILKRAIERTMNPPGWYFHLIAIDLYLKGDYEHMLEVAERSAADGSPFSHLLIAIASGALGNQEAARQALEKMSAFETLAHDPAGYARRHGATDEIADALISGLRKAGWVEPRS